LSELFNLVTFLFLLGDGVGNLGEKRILTSGGDNGEE
jgi:hypothetical protein